MSMKLYVGNLSFQTSSEELKDLFTGIGAVESAVVVEDRETGDKREREGESEEKEQEMAKVAALASEPAAAK